jgi:hypothetical protein
MLATTDMIFLISCSVRSGMQSCFCLGCFWNPLTFEGSRETWPRTDALIIFVADSRFFGKYYLACAMHAACFGFNSKLQQEIVLATNPFKLAS